MLLAQPCSTHWRTQLPASQSPPAPTLSACSKCCMVDPSSNHHIVSKSSSCMHNAHCTARPEVGSARLCVPLLSTLIDLVRFSTPECAV